MEERTGLRRRRPVEDEQHSDGWNEPILVNVIKEEAGWKSYASPINIVTVVYALGYTITIPLLPFMARRHTDNMESDAMRGLLFGLVMSAYHITKMISSPLIGLMSDKWGRREALSCTLLGSGLVFFLTLVIGQSSMAGLIISRLMLGCFASNGSIVTAYIGETVPTHQQPTAFAQHGAGWGIAYILATPMLSILNEDPWLVFFFAGVCMVVASVVVAVSFESSQGYRGEQWEGDEGFGKGRVVGHEEHVDTDTESEFDCASSIKSLPSTTSLSSLSSCSLSSLPEGQVVMQGSSCDDDDVNCVGVLRVGAELDSPGPAQPSSPFSRERWRSAFNRICVTPRRTTGPRRERERGAKRKALRGLVGVFRGMLNNRLVLGLFMLQAITPATHLGPLVQNNFGKGASVVSLISSIKAACRVIVPATPLMSELTRMVGGGARGGRVLAALSCLMTAVVWCVLPFLPTMGYIYFATFLLGVSNVVRTSTDTATLAKIAKGSSSSSKDGGKRGGRVDEDVGFGREKKVGKAVSKSSSSSNGTGNSSSNNNKEEQSGKVARKQSSAGKENIGAFFGWQHFMKGLAGVTSNMLTGWLTGMDFKMPFLVAACVDVLYAVMYTCA